MIVDETGDRGNGIALRRESALELLYLGAPGPQEPGVHGIPGEVPARRVVHHPGLEGYLNTAGLSAAFYYALGGRVGEAEVFIG